jgi:hypothetical protein
VAPTTTGVAAEPAILFDPRETMALQRLIVGVRDAICACAATSLGSIRQSNNGTAYQH